MFDRFQHPRPMISGVCAWMAERSGVPVWVIRVVALMLLVVHSVLAIMAYLAGAYAMRRAGVAASGLRVDEEVVDRFSRIDRRVARMEEAAWREQYRRDRF